MVGRNSSESKFKSIMMSIFAYANYRIKLAVQSTNGKISFSRVTAQFCQRCAELEDFLENFTPILANDTSLLLPQQFLPYHNKKQRCDKSIYLSQRPHRISVDHIPYSIRLISLDSMSTTTITQAKFNMLFDFLETGQLAEFKAQCSYCKRKVTTHQEKQLCAFPGPVSLSIQ